MKDAPLVPPCARQYSCGHSQVVNVLVRVDVSIVVLVASLWDALVWR